MTSGISTIDGQTTQALQTALGAEHAAVWCYTLAVAFLVEPQLSQARRDADVHRELRGRIEQTLSEIGQRPVSAQPAYATPRPVTDAASAAALAVVAETDCLTAWRAVLEQTTDKSLRQGGPAGPHRRHAALRGWRTVIGVTPDGPAVPRPPLTEVAAGSQGGQAGDRVGTHERRVARTSDGWRASGRFSPRTPSHPLPTCASQRVPGLPFRCGRAVCAPLSRPGEIPDTVDRGSAERPASRPCGSGAPCQTERFVNHGSDSRTSGGRRQDVRASTRAARRPRCCTGGTPARTAPGPDADTHTGRGEPAHRRPGDRRP